MSEPTTTIKPAFKFAGKNETVISIIYRAKKVLRKSGANETYIDTFTRDALSGDYDHLLLTVFRYFEVEEDENS
jgi:hypothetical protein